MSVYCVCYTRKSLSFRFNENDEEGSYNKTIRFIGRQRKYYTQRQEYNKIPFSQLSTAI